MKKTVLSIISACLALLCLTACSAAPKGDDMANNAHFPSMGENISGDASITPPGYNGADFNYNLTGDTTADPPEQSDIKFIENSFVKTSDEATSTFSADVDTASYAYFRKLITNGCSIKDLKTFAAGFRTEEMVNYFTYDYPTPQGDEVFGVRADIVPCPWNPDAALLRVGLRAKETERASGNNLVFLIDVSGSMQSEDKLPLLQSAFSYLTDQLSENDTVSIVTYSGEERTVLDGCPGNKKEKILSSIKSLRAEGSTNGEAGLRRAYEIAKAHFIKGGNNRIIMASDGDLNVGMSSPEALKAYVSDMKSSGVYLSVLGFGTGNYRDANMEALADNGNGVYYYIDGASEAEKVFCTDLTSTLYTVAEDVKLQLTFNPSAVKSYRLVGYENRVMDNKDFDNDAKDAGEVGSGHTLTVCYELILTDGAGVGAEGSPDEWLTLSVRHKKPGGAVSSLDKYSFGREILHDADDEMRFICAVIETSMLLHDSRYISADSGISTISDVLSSLEGCNLNSERAQFVELLDKLLRNN